MIGNPDNIDNRLYVLYESLYQVGTTMVILLGQDTIYIADS